MMMALKKRLKDLLSRLQAYRFGMTLGPHSQLHRTAFSHGRVRTGRWCSINVGAILDAQHGTIDIGNGVGIGAYSTLYGEGGITIGADARLGPHVVIVSSEHIYSDSQKTIRSQGITNKPVTIGSDVWIGAHATILAGSTIGDGCVIGANSLVKGTLEPGGIYVGNPARKIASRQNSNKVLLAP